MKPIFMTVEELPQFLAALRGQEMLSLYGHRPGADPIILEPFEPDAAPNLFRYRNIFIGPDLGVPIEKLPGYLRDGSPYGWATMDAPYVEHGGVYPAYFFMNWEVPWNKLGQKMDVQANRRMRDRLYARIRKLQRNEAWYLDLERKKYGRDRDLKITDAAVRFVRDGGVIHAFGPGAVVRADEPIGEGEFEARV